MLLEINIKFSIQKHHLVDASKSLVEHYNILINSNRFSIDPVVLELREHTSKIYNKIDYTLEDGSIVAIDESTLEKLRNLFFDKYNVIEYMNETKDNFFKVIQLII